MHVIAVDTNERLHDSDRISYFHYYMFHGMWDSENLDSVDPQTGEKRRNLMRNARIVPPIVGIHNALYVSERVKKKLEGVPGIRFVRTQFTRLVDYPFAKGDFSFYKTPLFQAQEQPISWEELFDRFLRSLADVPEYHRNIESFYKLETTQYVFAEELDPKAPKVSCYMPKATTESMRLRLSPRMVKAYPVIWYGHYFFADDVFALIEEDFDWDFFVRADLRFQPTPQEMAEALRTPSGDPVRFLRKLGAELHRDEEHPDQPVVWVTLRGSSPRVEVPMTEEVLQALEKLPCCTCLFTGIPQGGLAELVRLPQLRELYLVGPEDGPADEPLDGLGTLSQLEHLDLAGLGGMAHGLKEVARLRQLKMLDLSGTDVRDAALEDLAGLEQLEQLDLEDTRLGDAGLLHLARLARLRSLHLADTRVTDRGALELVKLDQLVELDLSGTRITDQGLRELARLPRLEHLKVWAEGVTDAGLAALGDMPSLKRVDVSLAARGDNWLALQVKLDPQADNLDLRETAVTDAGLAVLARLEGLRVLNLGGCRITDGGLKTLATLRSLRKVNLAKTQVTDAGLVHLMELPSLEKVRLSARAKGDTWLGLLVKIAPDADEVDASGSQVTAEGLGVLAGLPKLYGLFLLDVPLTDDAEPALSRLRQVGFLNLRGTGLTRRGVAALRKALPRCNIGTDWN
jgi:hypothetical protein